MTRARAPLLLCILSVVSAGCYTYTPVQQPAPGQIVRLHVPITSAIANPNAPPQTVAIEGQVLSASDTIEIATRTRREFGAFRELIEYDTFRVDVEQLAGMELREFSTTKSVVLTGLIVGGATGLALAALSIESGRGGNDDNGGGPVTTVVLGIGKLVGAVARLMGGG